jgi:GcrA cell cycle regulator
MEWNEEAVARLRSLWVEGHSTAEIGRRLAVTKNAVVGKAHRMNLLARPSPIRRQDTECDLPRTRQARHVVGSTLPPLPASDASVAATPAPPSPVAVAPPAHAQPAASPVPPTPPKLAPVAATVRARTMACCWPIGDPGTKSFRFCDAVAAPGKPYCVEHAALAYVKVRDRRDEAA